MFNFTGRAAETTSRRNHHRIHNRSNLTKDLRKNQSGTSVQVGALECFTKYDYRCVRGHPSCDSLGTYGQTSMSKTKCSPYVTMCGLMTMEVTVENVKFEYAIAPCMPEAYYGYGYTTGCHDRGDIGEAALNYLNAFGVSADISYDKIEVCLCNENLCNGSIKSAVLSLPFIILSVGISFMLYN